MEALQAALKSLLDTLTCPCCQQTCVDPHCLKTCGHRFCHACIMAKVGFINKCPVCSMDARPREVIMDPWSRKALEQLMQLQDILENWKQLENPASNPLETIDVSRVISTPTSSTVVSPKQKIVRSNTKAITTTSKNISTLQETPKRQRNPIILSPSLRRRTTPSQSSPLVDNAASLLDLRPLLPENTILRLLASKARVTKEGLLEDVLDKVLYKTPIQWARALKLQMSLSDRSSIRVNRAWDDIVVDTVSEPGYESVVGLSLNAVLDQVLEPDKKQLLEEPKIQLTESTSVKEHENIVHSDAPVTAPVTPLAQNRPEKENKRRRVSAPVERMSIDNLLAPTPPASSGRLRATRCMWTCSRCTYAENKPTEKTCEVCQASRPTFRR